MLLVSSRTGLPVLGILLTKTTDAQNEDTISYHIMHGLYYMVVVSVDTVSIL